MNNSFKSALVGFAAGLAVAAGGAQAAVQAMVPEHPAPAGRMATAPAMGGMGNMANMHAMVSNPTVRQNMLANMAQCRDMMSMMMDHMSHEGTGKDQPTPHP